MLKRLVQCGLASACLALGCAQTIETPAPPSGFSGEQAFAHLSQLTALGPRVAGTPGATQARAYVRSQLEALGLTVHEEVFQFRPSPELPELTLANLWAEVPGTRHGLFAVGTPLDTNPLAGPGANEGGSGAALLLELARALHETPLPYPVRLLFLDAELLDADTAFLGSEHAFLAFESAHELEGLRAWLYVHQVADRDLEIRRDRSSDRALRDLFFEVARREGLSAAFPYSAPFEDMKLGQDVFVAHRFRRVVALADIRYGGPDAPGPLWRTPGDDLTACDPGSLEAAGRVVLAGLRAVAARQIVVDAATGAASEKEEGHP